MPTDYFLKVTGSLRLSLASGNEVPIQSQRAQALFGYLALEGGGPVTRAALATLLWGDRGEDQARASLRQELSTLKKALAGDAPKLVGSDRHSVWLEATSLEIDTSGPKVLLAMLDIPSEPFQDWLRDTRSRHQRDQSKELLGKARHNYNLVTRSRQQKLPFRCWLLTPIVNLLFVC